MLMGWRWCSLVQFTVCNGAFKSTPNSAACSMSTQKWGSGAHLIFFSELIGWKCARRGDSHASAVVGQAEFWVQKSMNSERVARRRGRHGETDRHSSAISRKHSPHTWLCQHTVHMRVMGKYNYPTLTSKKLPLSNNQTSDSLQVWHYCKPM